MPEIVSEVLRRFGVRYEYDRVLLFGLLVAWVAVLALRMILAGLYRTELGLARSALKKGFESREEAEKAKSSFVRRAAKDYADLGERGLARIDSRELCRKSALRFKLLGWSYESVERFLGIIEPAFLPAGILLAVIVDDRTVFAAAVLLMFIGGKLLSTFFDFAAAKEELLSETAFMLDRELGRHYVTDAASSINNFRVELKNIMTYQAKFLSDSIQELKDKLSDVTAKTLGETAASIEATLKSVSAGAQTVLEPLAEWRLAIQDSHKAHEELNLSLVKMSGATDGFKERLADLEHLIEGYKAEFLENNRNVEQALDRLNVISGQIVDLCKNAAAQAASSEASLEFVRRGQGLLESSMNQYEVALKDITSSVGTGLGKILEFHAQTAYKDLADGAVEGVRAAGAANAETMMKLQDLLDRILEQSKNDSALIMNMRDQMEMEIKGLKNPNGEQR